MSCMQYLSSPIETLQLTASDDDSDGWYSATEQEDPSPTTELGDQKSIKEPSE